VLLLNLKQAMTLFTTGSYNDRLEDTSLYSYSYEWTYNDDAKGHITLCPRHLLFNLCWRLAMKALGSVFVMFLLVSCAAAQALSESASTPDVTVLQKKWRMDVHKDPYYDQHDREQEERARRNWEIQNEKLREQGMPTKGRPESPSTTKARSGLSVTYIYEVKVRNTGEKDVRTLSWDYVFSDPSTKQELGRQRFLIDVKLGHGKTRNVVVRAFSFPTGTIDAAKAGKKSRDMYSEQVIIQSISYADGSVWKAGSH
jgi:hypothetical protein